MPQGSLAGGDLEKRASKREDEMRQDLVNELVDEWGKHAGLFAFDNRERMRSAGLDAPAPSEAPQSSAPASPLQEQNPQPVSDWLHINYRLPGCDSEAGGLSPTRPEPLDIFILSRGPQKYCGYCFWFGTGYEDSSRPCPYYTFNAETGGLLTQYEDWALHRLTTTIDEGEYAGLKYLRQLRECEIVRFVQTLRDTVSRKELLEGSDVDDSDVDAEHQPGSAGRGRVSRDLAFVRHWGYKVDYPYGPIGEGRDGKSAPSIGNRLWKLERAVWGAKMRERIDAPSARRSCASTTPLATVHTSIPKTINGDYRGGYADRDDEKRAKSEGGD